MREDTATIVEIEAIKQLKARYCRLLDTKNWAAWREVFTDDFLSDTSQAGGKVIIGADDFVAFTRKSIGRPAQATAHHVHSPEINLTSPTTARGIWALHDVVRFSPGLSLHGYGHYTETYELADGCWRIRTSTLTRLREDIVTPIVSLYISPRLRDRAARLAHKMLADR